MATSDLTRSDIQSTTWKRTRAYLEQARAEARGLLEMDSDERVTYKLRGRIAAYNELLGLEKAPAQARQTGASPSDELTDPD